jgi:4-hydroxy-4-methyl-2-oxoglutarate aldolase
MASLLPVETARVLKRLLRRICLPGLMVCLIPSAQKAFGQVKQTQTQIMFYTSGWTGPRFPDGRPKLSDDLLERAKSMTIEDIWDFLREHGYQNQFEGGWQVLHSDKAFAGRALTAQYMPYRPDVASAIEKEGKLEGRIGGTNSWPIAELQSGDVYVADGFGKIVRGTLIGSNLGNAIAARDHTGFVFDAGIRDQEELREIPNFNGLYRGYDPSDWAQMELTSINAPIRIGRAVVLPGDLVLVKPGEGVIFIPAVLAEAAVSSAEFTALKDAYNFDLNREGKNGARFEGGWNAKKYAAFVKWIDAHPAILKMPRSEFDALIASAEKSRHGAEQPRRRTKSQ